LRRGTDTQHTTFTGAEGEVTVNTTNDSLHVHDGSTAGGTELAKADLSNAAGASIPGTLTANNLVVDDDGGGDPTVMIKADDAAPYALIVRNDTYSTAANTGFGVIQANAGDVSLDFRGNAEFKNVRFRQSDNSTTTEFIHADTNRAVHVKHDGVNKLSTTSTGIDVTGSVEADSGNITGTLTCNQLVVDDDGSSSPTVRISGDDGGPWGLVVNNSTYTSNAALGFRVNQQNDGAFLMDYQGDGSYETILIRSGDGTTSQNVITIDSNRAVNLHHANGTRLTTTSGGINVTGSVTCDGLVNDGDVTIQSTSGLLIIKDTDNDGVAAVQQIQGRGSVNDTDWYVGQVGTSNNDLYISNQNSAAVIFRTASNERCYVNASGHFQPWDNNTYDLGTSTHRWRNVYTNDLNLSNEGGANDVDGTWGNWTIQEGEDDLFLLNRRNGKKYKFNLSEVN
jgi:hypothetical protein